MENKNELIEAFWVSQGGKPNVVADIDFYESDWSMLMPVVERINRMDKTSVSIYPKHCIVSVNGTAQSGAHDFGSDEVNDGALIKIVYLSVVNYIEWYNKQSHGN